MTNPEAKRNQIKTVFMGTAEFSVFILQALLAGAEYNIAAVITVADKPVGRKQIITPPLVKILAQQYNVPVCQPENLEKSEFLDFLRKINPDLIVVAAYGKILPEKILKLPKYGCINVHPSLLPKYRGASPIQTAILNGEKETGVSIILMDKKMDHGPILAQEKTPVAISSTYPILAAKLEILSADLLIKTVAEWTKGKIKPRKQNDQEATYTKTLKKEDGRIDWGKSGEEIERQIRAFQPWPGTYTFFRDKNGVLRKIKILKAFLLTKTSFGPDGPVGKTFLGSNDRIAVQTEKDFLMIDLLQLEGRKPIKTQDFLRGHIDFIGTILE